MAQPAPPRRLSLCLNGQRTAQARPGITDQAAGCGNGHDYRHWWTDIALPAGTVLVRIELDKSPTPQP
jgi:hypothetical protein